MAFEFADADRFDFTDAARAPEVEADWQVLPDADPMDWASADAPGVDF